MTYLIFALLSPAKYIDHPDHPVILSPFLKAQSLNIDVYCHFKKHAAMQSIILLHAIKGFVLQAFKEQSFILTLSAEVGRGPLSRGIPP